MRPYLPVSDRDLQLLKKETKNYDIAGGGGEVGEEVQKSARV